MPYSIKFLQDIEKGSNSGPLVKWEPRFSWDEDKDDKKESNTGSSWISGREEKDEDECCIIAIIIEIKKAIESMKIVNKEAAF